MARLARVVVPGYPHHLTQRGVRSMRVFWDDEDREYYLYQMALHGRKAGLSFLAWCLMDNHVHLIVVPGSAESLARGVGEAHRRYTVRVNERQGTRGYLFQGRFHSCPLDSHHFLAALRYVPRNPVRSGLARHAWDYLWSSARYRVGLVDRDPLVRSADRVPEVADWRTFLNEEPEQIEDLRKCTRSGRPCGGKGFLKQAEALTGRTLRMKPRGRPRRAQK